MATVAVLTLAQVGESSEVRRALRSGGHAWFPDGQRIAFGRNLNAHAQLVVTNAAGDHPQVIWQSAEKDWGRGLPRGVTVAPGGHLFGLVGPNYVLAVVDENGNTVHQWLGELDHVWAPDGQALVADGSEFGTSLSLLSLNGRRKLLTRGHDVPGSWSENGRWIAFMRDRFDDGGMPDPGPYDVYLIRSSGGTPVRFARNAERPLLSPNGQRIAFWRPHERRFEIWTVRSNGYPGRLTKRLWAKGPEPARWSRNGRKLFVLGKESRAAHTLGRFEPASDDFAPAFSPDGTRILFADTRIGRCGIWLLTVASNKLKRVAGTC
jgi:Tol biopolymer transport system component